MKGEFVYANGMSISQARKLCRFYFGDFFIKADKNDSKLRFDIYIFDKIETDKKEIALLDDWCDVQYFDEFWNGKQIGVQGSSKKEGVFNVIVTSGEKVKK